MALMYAYQHWDGDLDQHGITPDGQHFLTIAMCRVPKPGKKSATLCKCGDSKCAKKADNGVRACKGSWGASEADGWDSGLLEIVVDSAHADDAQVYGLIFCFFDPDPEPERVSQFHWQRPIGVLSAPPAEPRAAHGDDDGDGGGMNMFVRRHRDTGVLEGCEFCRKHGKNPRDGKLATAFAKHSQVDGGVLGLRILALPRQHVAGVASAQFWAIPKFEMHQLLWELRAEALAAVEQAMAGSAEAHRLLRHSLHAAAPVWRGGQWVYDLETIRAGGVIYVYWGGARSSPARALPQSCPRLALASLY